MIRCKKLWIRFRASTSKWCEMIADSFAWKRMSFHFLSPEFCFLDGNFFSRELVEFVPWLTASFLLASQLEAQNRRGPWTLGRLLFGSCSDRRSHRWGHQHIEGIGGEERSSAGPVCCVLELVKSTNWRWEKLVTTIQLQFLFYSLCHNYVYRMVGQWA